MSNPPQPGVALWRRMAAYLWYAWGMSLCYWGIRTADRSFYQAGVDSFSRAVSTWPAFSAGYYRRGLIRGRELGEHQQGIEDLTRAIMCSPEWPEPYLQRGLFQRFHGDPRAALADLRRYVEIGADGYWRNEAVRQMKLLEEDQ